MKKLSATFLFLFCFLGAFYIAVWSGFENHYQQVCYLVASKVHGSNEKINTWLNTCVERSKLYKPWSSKTALINDIKNTLSLLEVSHLKLFTPEEGRRVWQGESRATGVRSQYIDSKLVILFIEKNSPAEGKDLQIGDVIESLNEEWPQDQKAYIQGGKYKIRRGDRLFEVSLNPAAYTQVRTVELQHFKRQKIFYLRVPSFQREPYLQDQSWIDLLTQAPVNEKLVIDLRGNSGGNFFAGLDFISHFLCKETQLGRMQKRDGEVGQVIFPYDYKDEVHIAAFKTSRELVLQAPQQKKCIKKSALILIDQHTSSVAEVTAQAFKEFDLGVVKGVRSAGQVMVALWYPLDKIQRGLQISIPEAAYVSHANESLERVGVEPQQALNLSVSLLQQGLGVWLSSLF